MAPETLICGSRVWKPDRHGHSSVLPLYLSRPYTPTSSVFILGINGLIEAFPQILAVKGTQRMGQETITGETFWTECGGEQGRETPTHTLTGTKEEEQL